MKPKVYSYVRFSSDKQAAGDSYRRQMAAAKAFCAENDLELVDSKDYLFFDRGRSAYKGQHLDDTGELARFLSYVEDGSIPVGSYLVVESLDRLSRERVRDALPRFLDLLNRGINVYTSTDKRLYTKDYNELDLIISIVAMSRAHEESRTKGGRVSSAWRQKHEEARAVGKPIGKLCPYWLQYHPDGYQLIEDRVQLVQRMFRMTIDGYGTHAIAKMLNSEGIPSFSAGRKNASGLWAFSSIKNVVASRAVLGEYQPHAFIDGVRTPQGDPVRSYFPAIISEEDFYAAQSARESRRLGQVTKTTKNFNVWTGVAKCFDCGEAMHLVRRKGVPYLRCYGAARGLCGSKPLKLDRTEVAFREVLAKVDSLSLVQDSSGALRKKLAVTEGRLSELTAKLEAAEELYSEVPTKAGARTLQSFEREQTALQEVVDQLKTQLSADKIINKADFFDKLDLVSYEGRAAANNLLKRLGLYVYMARQDIDTYFYALADASKPNPAEDENLEGLILDMTQHEGVIEIQGAVDEVLDLQFLHGESTSEQIEAMKWTGMYRGSLASWDEDEDEAS